MTLVAADGSLRSRSTRMDGDRKYRQHGYQETGRNGDSHRSERPRPSGPKLPLDVTGAEATALSANGGCGALLQLFFALSPDADFRGKCPKCGADLHCCKQCVNFDSSTRFQCLKPIPARIALKDQANTCELFSPRVTVARDVAPSRSCCTVFRQWQRHAGAAQCERRPSRV